MHGHERPVERKIRLWVVQQEHNRRQQGELSRVDESRDALGGHGEESIEPGTHDPSQGM